VLEPGNHPEHPLLIRNLEARLEAHEVPHLSRAVFLAELHDGVRLLIPGLAPGVSEADWLHRAEAEDVAPARRHLFDREAALEVRRAIELVVRLVLLAGPERRDECVVLCFRERGIPIVVAPTLPVA